MQKYISTALIGVGIILLGFAGFRFYTVRTASVIEITFEKSVDLNRLENGRHTLPLQITNHDSNPVTLVGFTGC